MDNVKEINISAENKYSSIGHHEQKKKPLVKLNFWWSQ